MTALASLIGGDAKTGAKILGHSPQTVMRYVRANDDTARGAIEKMAEGLPPSGEPAYGAFAGMDLVAADLDTLFGQIGSSDTRPCYGIGR